MPILNGSQEADALQYSDTSERVVAPAQDAAIPDAAQLSDEDKSAQIGSLPTLSERVSATGKAVADNLGVYKANQEENTWTGSLAAYGTGNGEFHMGQAGLDFDPNYNVVDKLKGTQYESFASDAVSSNVHNDQQLEQWQQNMQLHAHNQAILESGGTTAKIASLASGIIDPINLIPFVGIEAKGALFADAVKGFASGGAYGAAYSSLNEAGINVSAKPLQSYEEHVTNVAATALTTGILGGAIGLVAGSIQKTMTGQLKSILDVGRVPEVKTPDELPKYLDGGTAGAKYNVESKAGIAYLGSQEQAGKIISAVQLPTDYMKSPTVLAARSSSNKVRSIGDQLFENNIIRDYQTPEEGIQAKPEAVDRRITSKIDSVTPRFNKDVSDHYNTYLSRASKDKSESKILNFDEFKEQAQYTIMVDPDHPIPEVKAAADAWTKHLGTANKWLKDVGEFPEDVHISDPAYMTRVMDLDKIMADRKGAYRTFKEALKRNSNLDDAEAAEKAQSMIDDMIGNGTTRSQLYDMNKDSLYRGIKWNKERMDIPTSEIWDYVKHDLTATGNAYIAQAARIAELRTWMNDIGIEKLDDAPQLIADEFASHTDESSMGLKQKLGEDKAENMKLVQDMIDIITGRYSQRTNWDNNLRVLNSLTYSQMMGQVAITAISHSGVGVMKYGLGPKLVSGYGKILKEFSEGVLTSHIDDLKAMDIIIDRMNDANLRSILDPAAADSFPTKAGKVWDKILGWYGKINLMDPYIRQEQLSSAFMAEERIMRDVTNYANLSDKEKIYLSNLHIDSTNVEKIASQTKKYGDTEKNWANLRMWDNAEAQHTMATAIHKEMDTLVPKAGKGDIPMVMQRYQAARNIFQFTTFFNGVATKVLINSMQVRDANVIKGFASMITLGAASYIVKEHLHGRKPDLSTNNLMLEGVSRSGMFGLWTRFVGGIISEVRDGKTSYYGQSAMDGLLGPTASDINAAYKVGKAGVQQLGVLGRTGGMNPTLNKTMLRSGKSLLPFRNLWELTILNTLMNGAKDKEGNQ